MTAPGFKCSLHTEVLAQEFWGQVPEEKKKSVLESADAWCVPAPEDTRICRGAPDKRRNRRPAKRSSSNYANCITNKVPESRRQVAMGLAELAPLYASCDETFFIETIRMVGVQLAEEKDSELQSLVGAAFVRLSQEAAKKRSYPASPALGGTDRLCRNASGLESGKACALESGSKIVCRISSRKRCGGRIAFGPLETCCGSMPQPAAEQIAARFTRAGFREDCELLVSMIAVLGPRGS